MKLVKIYSNISSMKPVIFNSGLNIIYGDVSQYEGDSNEHNLGKTSLVYLIDFLLLKKIDKNNIFRKRRSNFLGWDFYLEVELDDKSYLTIKRNLVNDSRISIKLHKEGNQDLSSEVFWDYKDKSISAKKEEENAVKILKNILKFDVLSEYNLRHFLSYLLRTQNDYADVFRLSTFKKDKNWKPPLLSLFGYNGQLFEKKYDLEQEISIRRELIAKMKSDNLIEKSEEAFKLQAAIKAREDEKKSIEKNLEMLNFFTRDEQMTEKIVKEFETKISILNSEEYSLKYEVDKINKSLENNVSVKVSDVKKIYEEVEIFFPDKLTKSYEELANFNKQISDERSKYLKKELDNLNDRLMIIKKDLKEYNDKLSEALSIIKEKDAFIKFRKYQNELIKIETDIAIYKQKIESIDTIENYSNAISEIREKSKEISSIIKGDLAEEKNPLQEIREMYTEIFRKTMDGTATFAITPNKYGYFDFEPFVISGGDLTGQGDGYTATKVQCAAFVIAALAYYSKNSFYKFAYHDGIFEGWGDNPKINFINLIREYCDKYKIQYIASMIKSDIPKNFDFEKEEIIITLDKNQPLFGIKF
ncbi:MAG: DUF2326 domain-containing protein [Parcubacteria group bacterium]